MGNIPGVDWHLTVKAIIVVVDGKLRGELVSTYHVVNRHAMRYA